MKPGHSITKGYPHDTIISQERFKNRLGVFLDKGRKNKVHFLVDKAFYPDFKGIYPRMSAAGFRRAIDFLIFRLFDYAEALLVAENHIEHLLEEQPFIAEDFGFIKVVGPKDITDNPTKIYTSKYDDTISIFRNMSEEYEWHLIKNNGGAFQDTKLLIPNHRIAYALFFALGIKVEEVSKQEEEKSGVLKDFTVMYSEPKMLADAETPQSEAIAITLKACDEEDARSKAQFIFANGNFGFKKVTPENLTIINK